MGSSISGVIAGVLFIILSIGFLFWNEGNAVQVYESLKEGASSVTSVQNNSVIASNEGKLVHFSGMTQTEDTLRDTDFGISQKALKFRRIVEVYQWVEKSSTKTTEKLGGGTETTTTYTYEKQWSDSLVSSASFKEAQNPSNPTSKLFDSKNLVASNVKVGAFMLPESMVNSLSGYQAVAVTPETFSDLPYETQEKLKVVANTVYYGVNDVAVPQIGDTRIRFEVILPQEVSVVAMQKGSSLEPFITKNKKTISMIQTGNISAEDMFASAIEGNNTMTMIFRVIGFFIIFAGINMLLQPIRTFFSVVPFFGRIVGFGNSIVAGIFAVGITLTTIAIAWLFARPLLSIGLIVLVVAGFLILGTMKRNQEATNSKEK